MPQIGHWNWCGLGILSLLLVLLMPSANGDAQTETGLISGLVFDDFSWMPVEGLCSAAISQADGTVYTDEEPYTNRIWLSDLPIGIYDLTVENCGTEHYGSSTIHDIEVVPSGGYPEYWMAASNVTVLLTLENAAVITGQVVEDYSGYPLEGKRAELIDATSGESIKSTCTNEDGWYQLTVTPGRRFHVRFGQGCSSSQPNHRPQWYPFADSAADAEAILVQRGSHAVAHAAMTVRGGFVGTIYDPTGQIPGFGWQVVAKEGYYLSNTRVRQDGSFAVTRIGQDILLRMEPPANWVGIDWGYLADPNNPKVAAQWDVGLADLFDLGIMGLDRPPALSGRVLDTNGYPIHKAVVSFYAEDEHIPMSPVYATTDQLGWYVTNEAATGNYTAVVTVPTSNHAPAFEYNATWLGNTPERSEATVLHLDGTSRGGIDFVVKRGEASGIDILDYTWKGPQELTTDRERNGATLDEPLEVFTSIATQMPASVGTTKDQDRLPGFDHFVLGASVVYDPVPTAPPSVIGFALETSLMTGTVDDMQVLWNGRRLGNCSIVDAPCLVGISEDSRSDLVVSTKVRDGGEASFVWGPRFLDSGVSVFLDDIEWLADTGVTKGCSPPINDLFCPNDQVTRGQMAAFLVRFLGLTDSGDTKFLDDDGSIFETDIERLAAAGITRGCNPPANDKFCPGDPVTRDQMAAFLTRALKLPAATGIDFNDDDGSIFEDAIERLATAGITKGCNPPTNDHFCPSATVTREQMAAFLHRAGLQRP